MNITPETESEDENKQIESLNKIINSETPIFQGQKSVPISEDELREKYVDKVEIQRFQEFYKDDYNREEFVNFLK